jgi:phage terminase small subunit
MNAPILTPLQPDETVFSRLTAKQQAFVDHWVRYRNAGQAYRRAYDVQRMNAGHCAIEGMRLLARDDVGAAVRERQQLAAQGVAVDVQWLLQRFLDIATADPRELIGLRVGCCRYCHGVDHGYQWREREYLEQMAAVDRENEAAKSIRRPANIPYPDPAGGFGFNATLEPVEDCPQCHGEGVERFVPRDTDALSDQALLLYGGLKVKADGGYEIVVADRSKALELVGRIMGAFDDKLRIHGTVGAMVAIGDLRKVDPQDAAKAYRALIEGSLAA